MGWQGWQWEGVDRCVSRHWSAVFQPRSAKRVGHGAAGAIALTRCSTYQRRQIFPLTDRAGRHAMDRRTFVAASAGTLVGPWRSALFGRQQPAKTRLILLGTGGGPRPRTDRTAPAQVILVNNSVYA